MAFNPFESFRKNNKAIFAVVTIVCMFTFVLSSGIGQGGDIFDWFSRMLGGRDDRGAVLGEIDGKEYHQRNLEELRRRRMAANLFLLYAVNRADQHMRAQIMEDLKNKNFTEKNFARIVEFALDSNADPRFREQALGMLLRMRQGADPKDATPESAIVDRVYKIVMDEEQQRERRSRGSFFLDTNPANNNDADALQFALFLREADKMGVKFTDANLQEMINEQTGMPFDRDGKEANLIKNIVRKQTGQGFSSTAIDEAVADEFRVRTATGILLNIPTTLTPYQFFEYYKDNFESVGFDVIDVPVERYLAEVKEEPTDKEIRDLFDAYRKVEYDPSRPTPGFKEPRKVKLEYVGVDGKMPNYQPSSPSVQQLQAASYVASGLGASTGRDMVTGIMTVAAPGIAEPLVIREMAAGSEPLRMFHEVWPGAPNRRLADSSMYNPLPDAALTAQLAVLRNPVTDLCSALAAYQNMLELIEIRDRAKVGMQLVVAPLGFNPVSPLASIAPVAVAGPLLANSPASLTGVYHAREAEKNSTMWRPQRLARADLDSLQEKLLDIRKKTQPKPDFSDFKSPKKKNAPKIDPKVVADANAEARKLIDEWVKARSPGALTGKSDRIRDKYTIADDPGLKALRELVDSRTLPYETFDRLFFQDRAGTESTKETAAASLFDPKFFPFGFLPSAPTFSKPVYMGWKTEEEIAKIYDKIADAPPEMKQQVIRAWKFQKARVLAKAAADKLAGEVNALGKMELREADNIIGFTNGLRDLIQKGRYHLIAEPIRLSRLHKSFDQSPQMPQAPPMASYKPAELHNQEIPYPSPLMTRQLLDVRNKPLGEVVVTPDQPESNYYVSVMVQKDVPTALTFYNDVFKTINPGLGAREPADPLYRRFAVGQYSEAAIALGKDAMDRIKGEVKYKETDELKKELEGRASRGDLPIE